MVPQANDSQMNSPLTLSPARVLASPAEAHRDLLALDRARQILAECATVDEARNILNMAEAARVYAKKARFGLEAQNHAAKIKLYA